MVKLDLQKNLEMPMCRRWQKGEARKGQTLASKESRGRRQGSYTEAKTINKVSRVEYCKTVRKDTGLNKRYCA